MNEILSERVNLFEPNVYIQFLVEITGNPDTEALLAAVNAAFAANETAMSKIVLGANGEARYERMPESGCKAYISQDGWENITKHQEKNPFAIDRGELMRVFILNAEGAVSLLVIAHHLAGDGKSIVYFIEDVMTALAGKPLAYKPIRLIGKASLPKGSENPLLFKLYASRLNKQWKQAERAFGWTDYYAVHESYWKQNRSVIVCARFSSEEIGTIHAYAKKIGVSVNSFVAAAFLEADRHRSALGMAVNARMDGNKSMSNQVTGISVDHRYSDKMTFDENARRIHKKVQQKLKNPVKKYFILHFIPLIAPSLIDAAMLQSYGLCANKTAQRLAEAMGYIGEKPRELGITNLTRLDIPDAYGAYGLKNGVFIPPVVTYARYIIGVSTMQDGMTISFHYMNCRPGGYEPAFFKRAIRNIKANCGIPQ